MSTLHVYNTKQQALNARKIAELFSFTSNDFGGMVSSVENPIVFSTENSYKWSWNTDLGTQLHFIGGGVDISCDIDLAESWTFIQDTSENKKYYMWGLDVTIPSDKSSIVTDVYDSNSAKIAQIACQEITFDYLYAAIEYPSGNPHEKEYYEYSALELNYVISEDTEVDVEKVYYYRLDTVFTVTNAEFDIGNKSFDYYGNTVWLNSDQNRFFIPFCYIDKEGVRNSMIFNRDKAGYESFLSARSYYYLLQELGNQFVFRVGGPTKGDIGRLNVTNNIISNKENIDEGVVIINPSLTISGSDDQDLDYVLIRNEGSGRIYKTVPTYTIPIKHGGTSSRDKNTARQSLGFNFGTSNPSEVPKRIDGTTVDEGAIYFKLL